MIAATIRCQGGWKRHDLAGNGPFFLYERPRRRRNGMRFEVCERGAGRRGTARVRGETADLAGALALAGRLAPSTPGEILAHILTSNNGWDKDLKDKLTRLGVPGTPLWVTTHEPGMGYAATSGGLCISAVGALFGGELEAWQLQWRTPDDQLATGLYPVALQDARRAWWILTDADVVVAGGPRIYDGGRAAELAAEFGGRAQRGLGRYDPGALYPTNTVTVGDGQEAAVDDPEVLACRICGCTEERACPGGCYWVPDPTLAGELCSRCAPGAAGEPS